MALVSPGVEVTVIDESQYIPSAPLTLLWVLLTVRMYNVWTLI